MYSIRPSSEFLEHTRDEYVYDQLCALLSNESYGAGTRLPSETALANRFGVSRALLRQALARLRGEQRIHSRKGAGHFVGVGHSDAPLLAFSALNSVPDVHHFLTFRRALEGETAGVAATVCDSGALSKLRRSHGRLHKSFDAGHAGIEDDIGFHMAVAQATHNRFFTHTIGALLEQMRFSVKMVRELAEQPLEQRRQDVLKEHDMIVEAIARGDADAARIAMHYHLEQGIKRLNLLIR